MPCAASLPQILPKPLSELPTGPFIERVPVAVHPFSAGHDHGRGHDDGRGHGRDRGGGYSATPNMPFADRGRVCDSRGHRDDSRQPTGDSKFFRYCPTDDTDFDTGHRHDSFGLRNPWSGPARERQLPVVSNRGTGIDHA